MINKEKLADPISKEYQRWIKKIGNDDPSHGPNIIGVQDILRAHFLMANYFYVNGGEGISILGPRSLDLLHSTLSRQTVSLNGTLKWQNSIDIVALFFSD